MRFLCAGIKSPGPFFNPSWTINKNYTRCGFIFSFERERLFITLISKPWEAHLQMKNAD